MRDARSVLRKLVRELTSQWLHKIILSNDFPFFIGTNIGADGRRLKYMTLLAKIENIDFEVWTVTNHVRPTPSSKDIVNPDALEAAEGFERRTLHRRPCRSRRKAYLEVNRLLRSSACHRPCVVSLSRPRRSMLGSPAQVTARFWDKRHCKKFLALWKMVHTEHRVK